MLHRPTRRAGRARTTTAALAAALIPLLGVAACSGAEADPGADTLAAATGELSAVLLRPEAEQAFERKGHPIEGALQCRSPEGDAAELTVVCSGRTEDGEKARFEGRVDPAALAAQRAEDEGLPGAYTGTVAGREVFRMTCFNCEPKKAGARDRPRAQEERRGPGGEGAG
ncbi:hypothetical protein ACFPZ0_23015 [Streptomonospora nanhaiensis]|uniref:Lipoprotein n=1 Tax=Streptomonospora nanhaiensis TaxID=1323731 RepID=A0A853BIQ7_9ACTN|nr:hypothetical protein [Streptomonospora nanhaiensis]MBV2365064.1 hypothetical protein [Streptomonospora nanhaiensis]MBX9388267.1 hypothetical protein [Streptomonospora nanhaiensis]NYI94477.1 hypothetical protein [Streptomonospora nanhaiensis]